MGASPRWKVHDSGGKYIASCAFPEDAALLISRYGNGAMIKDAELGRRVVWTEGQMQKPASESCDYVAEVCYNGGRE